jgi:hypothetical protein
MHLITVKGQIKSVVNRWREQYPKEKWPDKQSILHKLEQLDLDAATSEDLKRVIGNYFWARPQECHECGKEFEILVQLGRPEDYESYTANICIDCLNKALKLIKSEEPS